MWWGFTTASAEPCAPSHAQNKGERYLFTPASCLLMVRFLLRHCLTRTDCFRTCRGCQKLLCNLKDDRAKQCQGHQVWKGHKRVERIGQKPNEAELQGRADERSHRPDCTEWHDDFHAE